MKRLYAALLFSALVIAACTELPQSGECEESTCVVSLRLRYVDENPFTKSTSLLDEILVEDVNVYVADANGAIIYQEHFSPEVEVAAAFEILGESLYDVYVLANWGESLEVTDESELLELMYTAQDAVDLAGEKCARILCGKVEDVKFPLQNGVLDVKMGRILSKVRVVCDFSQVYEQVTIEPVRVSIKNVPLSTALFAENIPVEVGDGAVYTAEELGDITVSGVEFFLFENMQGYVGDASDNKRKTFMMTEQAKALSTYIEIECDVVSQERRGTSVYRFYLGTDHTNCNVLRNATQTVTVKFSGYVSQGENSFNVDNSALGYRVTYVSVSPSSIQFTAATQTLKQCKVTVYPSNAADQRVVWSTTNSRVATVDQNGVITTRGTGKCEIKVTSVDCPQFYASVNVRVYNYNGG